MTRTETIAPANGSNTIFLALAGGAIAGLVVAFRMKPKRNRALAQANDAYNQARDTYDDFADAGRKKKKSLISSILGFADKGLRTAEAATSTVQKVREKVSDVIHNGAKEAHGAIDAGARAGHSAVDNASGSLRNAIGV